MEIRRGRNYVVHIYNQIAQLGAQADPLPLRSSGRLSYALYPVGESAQREAGGHF